MIDPLTKGKIRSGRDDGRPTEDDIARQRLGEQGMPGVAKPQVLDDDKLQNPKPIDPGARGVVECAWRAPTFFAHLRQGNI